MDVVKPELLVDGGVRIRLIDDGQVVAVMTVERAWALSEELANCARRGTNVEAALNGS